MRGLRAALLGGAMVLAGCSTMPPDVDAVAGDALSGRLSVRVDAAGDEPARAVAASFELRGTPDAGRLDLSTPLGNVLARARWNAASVALDTPQGARRYADLDALTREVLGESVPVAAFFDWLLGVPWRGAPSTPAATGGGDGFEQLGWAVDVSGVDRGSIAARRAAPPAVTVRVQLDRR